MDPLSIAAVGWSITAVGWLMSALVSKAVTTLLEAWAKRVNLGNEFKTLKDQLLQLGALLTSARRRRTDNTYLDELVQNLQQLAYQAENLFDELDYYRLEDEIQQRGTKENVNCSNEPSAASSSSGFRHTRHSILSTLKGMTCCSTSDALEPTSKTFSSRINLSRRMNELAKQLQKYEDEVRKAVETESLVITSQNTEISQTEATNLPQTSPFHTEHIEVVGRDQERDQLMNLLTNEETAIVGKVHVLAIVGCGGVGKTTLAGLVFNDPKVCSYFNFRSWICVSTSFDIVRLTREMLEGACGNRYDGLSNLEVLQKKLKDKLELKRFLLVLDDMWEHEDKSQWDKIIALLNNCMVKRGIILVTTRNQSVAEMVHARDNIYLRGLDDNAFLSFFSICIFNDPNYGGNWRLKKVGQEIAKKLKGNPLAAKTVSALLKKKVDERYWMEIRDSEEWKIRRGPNAIMPALWLSYEHMPFHLQRCFSYCAIFPEDHPFTCNELVYLWMAQGFLDMRSGGKRIEDIGGAYFVDLFNRGFFQTKQSRIPGLMHYTFHDLIHDLACSVASKECLSINGPEPSQLGQIPATIRHLSIFNSSERCEEAIVRALGCLDGENLTTIINSDQLSSGTSESISDLLKKTRFLRAMKLKQDSMVHHDYFIQNFVSLRYLSLNFGIFPGSNDTPSYTIPSEICRLYHLKVFQIEAAWNLDKLPSNFTDLVSLRHFIVEGDLHSKIWGVGKLTSLQELNYFNVQENRGYAIEQLGPLEEIGGSLQISNLENVKSKEEASKARIAKKKKLDALYLKWNHGEQGNKDVLEGLKPNTNLKLLEIRGYGGVASPTWLEPSLIFLESLTLEDCKEWQHLPPIGELEFLKHLKLSGLATREIGPRCYGTRQSMKFSSLERMEIMDMPDLEKWVWSDQLQQFLFLKKLKELTIEGCHKLVDLPFLGCATSEVLERFPSLESLKIEDCPSILQLPPLPYKSVLSFISIARIKTTKSRLYVRQRLNLNLILDENSSLKVGERLSFHEFTSLCELEISNISSLESLDLHSCVCLENLAIKECQSLTSLTFGEHLVCLKYVKIRSCKSLSSMKGLKSWVNLERLYLYECPGFIAAWDSASKEIERTEPDFHGFISPRELEISNISSLESLDLHSCVRLENLAINECQSLTSLTFGEHLVYLKFVKISSCKSLSSMKGLKSWVNLERLYLYECPGFIAAWDSASKEIERTEPDFHGFISPRELEISNISSLESLDLRSCVRLENLAIKECQSLTSLTFGEHLVCLKCLEIRSCKSLSSMKGLKSCVNLERLYFYECPGFTAAWDSASKEIERTEPDFHGFTSLRELEISDISSLESLDLHSCVRLENLAINNCQSLTSLTFGEHLVCLKCLEIRFCKSLSSMKGLKSWVNLERLYFKYCPGFIAAWDSASKEMERAEPDSTLSLTRIKNSQALLTLPISKQLTSLKVFELEYPSFTKEHEISPQHLSSFELVDIKGCKNLQSFPFDIFPSLERLWIALPHIPFLPRQSHIEITEETLNLVHIKEVHIRKFPVEILLDLSSEQFYFSGWDAVN